MYQQPHLLYNATDLVDKRNIIHVDLYFSIKLFKNVTTVPVEEEEIYFKNNYMYLIESYFGLKRKTHNSVRYLKENFELTSQHKCEVS